MLALPLCHKIFPLVTDLRLFLGKLGEKAKDRGFSLIMCLWVGEEECRPSHNTLIKTVSIGEHAHNFLKAILQGQNFTLGSISQHSLLPSSLFYCSDFREHHPVNMLRKVF